MVDKTSQMFVTGPDVIKTVTGEDVGMEELGGAYTHNTRSGVAHYLAEDEDDAIDYVRTLLGFLPDNNMAELPVYESGVRVRDDGCRPLPEHDHPRLAEPAVRHPRGHPRTSSTPRTSSRCSRCSRRTSSSASAASRAAPSASSPTSRRRWPARSTSRPARRPAASCGSATRSRSRSSRSSTCPGYLPGTDQEWTGVIRRGAKLLYAYAEATVPLVTVILRKAYGGAYIVMGSKQLGADINLAWPTAEIAVMGGQGAVNILYRGEIKRAEEAGEDVAAVRTRLANEYTYNVASPFLAAERGELDGIIEPAQTRVVDREGAAGAARQAREPAAQEAREHPAVTGDGLAADGRHDRRPPRHAHRGGARRAHRRRQRGVRRARRRTPIADGDGRPRRPGRCRSARCASRSGATSAGVASEAEPRRCDGPTFNARILVPRNTYRRDGHTARILEQLERFCVRLTCSPLCGELRFGHADGFRVTVR